MTESTITEVQQLIQEGRAAALAGDAFAARRSFRRATELDPDSAEAWIGLSSVVPVLAEKRDYLDRALAIEPDNAEAQASLRYVEKLLGEGFQIAPSQRRAERIASGDASPLLSAPEPANQTATETAFCYRHPDRETGLHCIQCNRPICTECAHPAAVGQLCPECRKERTPRNYQVSAANMLVGGIVGLLAATIAGFPLAAFRLGFFIILIIFFVAPLFAELVIRISDQLTKAKRGRRMQIAIGTGIGLGGLSWLLLTFNIFLLFFFVLAIVTAVARLK